MSPDSVTAFSSALSDYAPVIELGVFGIVVIWLIGVSRAAQALNRRQLQTEIAAKDTEIQALQTALRDKEQMLEMAKQDTEIKLEAKQAEVTKFESILAAKEQELKAMSERLHSESSMYKDIITAKDEKFELQKTILQSLEARHAQEIELFQQRYDAIVNQRTEAIGSES